MSVSRISAVRCGSSELVERGQTCRSISFREGLLFADVIGFGFVSCDSVAMYALHRYRPQFGPFRNILSSEPVEAEAILDQLRSLPGHEWLVPDYLVERRVVEGWLRQGHEANGGNISGLYPVYFSLWPKPPELGPYDILLPLGAFEERELSFTFPDSMISHGIAYRMREGEEKEQRPYHGLVFDLVGIDDLIAKYGCRNMARGASNGLNTTVRSKCKFGVMKRLWRGFVRHAA